MNGFAHIGRDERMVNGARGRLRRVLFTVASLALVAILVVLGRDGDDSAFLRAAAINLAVVAWSSFVLPLRGLPAFESYFRLRAWERSGRLYRVLGVPAFRVLVRRGPLSTFNHAIVLAWRSGEPRRIEHEIRAAEAGHAIAFGIVLALSLVALLRGHAAGAAWLAALDIPTNLYPVLLQRWHRVRLARRVAARGVAGGRLALVLAPLLCALLASGVRADDVLEGYVTPLSVAPGETLSIHASSPVPWTLTFARYHRVGDQNVPIPMSAPIAEPAGEQEAPDSAWYATRWNVTDRFVIPQDWPSGIYGAECVAHDFTTFRIAFVVRPRPDAHGDIAILANTNTWNAYNSWGGRSKYTNPPAHHLSMQRPNPSANPVYGSMHLARAELWVHDFLATSGYHVDTYSDWDFHQGIPGLDRYRTLVIDTHPEYWSRTMLDRLQTYLAHGGALVDLGGNAIYEEVRFSPDGTLLEMFPEYFCGTTGCRAYSFFRNLSPPRPERAILGVAYRCDAYWTWAPFLVVWPGHRFFAGTGVASGDTIGRTGLNGAASGWEMDTSLPGWVPEGIVSGCGADDRGVAPDNLELLARAFNLPTMGADMTWYSTPAGGGVFAAGSISFGGSLAVDSVLQRIVRNVIDELLARPAAVGPRPDALPPVALAPAAPNPFARQVRIAFTLAAAGPARLRVYDVAGRRVRTLLDERALVAGPAEVTWDGRDDAGRDAPGGVYLVRLETGGRSETRRVLRLR